MKYMQNASLMYSASEKERGGGKMTHREKLSARGGTGNNEHKKESYFACGGDIRMSERS